MHFVCHSPSPYKRRASPLKMLTDWSADAPEQYLLILWMIFLCIDFIVVLPRIVFLKKNMSLSRKDKGTFLNCNLCHIAGALEFGRHPGPSVIMNSFLLSLSFSGYPSLSVCLFLFIYISLCLCPCKMVFSKVINTHHQTSRV